MYLLQPALTPRGRSVPIRGAVVARIFAQPESGLCADHRLRRAAAGEGQGLDMATLLIFAGPQMCVLEPQPESEGAVPLFGEQHGNTARCTRFSDALSAMLWLS